MRRYMNTVQSDPEFIPVLDELHNAHWTLSALETGCLKCGSANCLDHTPKMRIEIKDATAEWEFETKQWKQTRLL